MIAAIIQARLGSKRFPKKIFKKLGNNLILEVMYKRISMSKKVNKIIICTTNNKLDDQIELFCKKFNIEFFRGSENNVMLRYIKCAEKFNIKHIIRLTGDCPLVDPKDVDRMISLYKKTRCDYLANTCPPEKSKFPNGSDIEIFSAKKLSSIYNYEKRKKNREHVTLNFWKENKYKSIIFDNKKNLSKYRYTLDYFEDLKVINKIYTNFKTNILNVSRNEIIDYLDRNPEISKYNEKYK